MNEENREADKANPLTEEQQTKLRRARWFFVVFRLCWSLLFLSLFAGGPHRFFVVPEGQVFSVLFFLVLLVDVGSLKVEVRGERQDRGSFFIIRGAIYTMYAVSILDHFVLAARWNLVPWIQWSWVWLAVGAALVAGGAIMRVVAIRTLGRFFTYGVRVQEGQNVVQQGLYASMRHPAYTGLLISSVGYAVLFASAFGLAIFLLMVVPAIINRISVEEKALRRGLGEEYLEYSRRVKRLIPFVY